MRTETFNTDQAPDFQDEIRGYSRGGGSAVLKPDEISKCFMSFLCSTNAEHFSSTNGYKKIIKTKLKIE